MKSLLTITLAVAPIALLMTQVAGCTADTGTEPNAPVAEAAQEQQAHSEYARDRERLEIVANLPIGGDTVLHYRYVNGDQVVSLDVTSESNGLDTFFSKLSPELLEQIKLEVPERQEAARSSDLVPFFELQQGVIEAAQGDKVLYCDDHTANNLMHCSGCGAGRGYVHTTIYNCSGWWIFCSCDSYSYDHCTIWGGCG